MLTGTIVNTLAILAGSSAGMFLAWAAHRFSSLLPCGSAALGQRLQTIIMQGVALCVMYLGISGCLKGSQTMVAILSMVLGAILGELLDLGVKLDLVQKSGSWFSMGETRLGQGRDAAKQYLKDNPEVADGLEAAIRRDFFKLMGAQSQIAAKAAGRAVDVSADDFEDED